VSYPRERQCDDEFIKAIIDGRVPFRSSPTWRNVIRAEIGSHDSATARAAHDQCPRSVDLLAPF
jgi:hypothetical protein